MKRVILFEKDEPIIVSSFVCVFAGVYSMRITPGTITITDDYGLTGYYEWNNSKIYNIKSLSVDNRKYTQVSSFAELATQPESFYYDTATTDIYIRFTNYNPWWLYQLIEIGIGTGFSYNIDIDNQDVYFFNQYYSPVITNILNIKKSKDPLFFGVLKFQSGSVKMTNEHGEFDDWRNENHFRQSCRLLLGREDQDYSEYTQFFSGYIEDSVVSWNDFSLKVKDIRGSLTQPVAQNNLNQTDYPDLNESNVDAPIPVAYGIQVNAPCYCLNEDEAPTPTNYEFIFCDTEFNFADSLDTVYVNGVSKTPASTDLLTGKFELSVADVGGNFGDVTADFTGSSITNGVEIIKDLMINYGSVAYLEANWDFDEMTIAIADSRDTSLYVDEKKDLSKVIQDVCIDIDATFFSKDNSLYTVRIYDENRTPTRTIETYEWIDSPELDDSPSEFLSSVIIEYNKDITNDTYFRFENTSYEAETFDLYRAKKTKVIKTSLTTLADATAKSETIMNISKVVQPVVTRSVDTTHFDLEIMDFITCDPWSRITEDENLGTYEIIGIAKDALKNKCKLTLRYIYDTDPSGNIVSVRIDSDQDFRITSDGDSRITVED